MSNLSDRIIDASAEAIMVTDSDNRIVKVNPAFTRITGFKAEEAIGSPPTLLSSGKHPKSFYEDLWFALNNRGFWQGEIWNKRKSGEVYPEWVSINVLRDERGQVSHHVAFFSDITLQKEGHAQMQRLAHYDVLTGLGNRLLMRDRLTQAVAFAKQADCHVAVLFIDLDRFKQVNDRLGHNVGDALLIAVSDRMRNVTRADDTVFRQGGDEFIVVLPNIEHLNKIPFIAKRLVSEVSKPYMLSDNAVEVGASIGISIYPLDSVTVDGLLEKADAAMYQAKKSGRGRVCCGDTSLSLISVG